MTTAAIDSILQDNLAAVRETIAAAERRGGRSGARLVAVTKAVGEGITRRLADLGQRALGENRVQDAEPKIERLGDRAEWHLIGHLQSNKARRAVALFDWIHSIDSPELMARVDRAAAELARRPRVLLQVNVSGEDSKSGAAPAELPSLLDAAAKARACDVVGLMTMAPQSDDPQASRPHFAALRELLATARAALGERCDQLSMGMSDDYAVAVEEGATLVRVGRALFRGLPDPDHP